MSKQTAFDEQIKTTRKFQLTTFKGVVITIYKHIGIFRNNSYINLNNADCALATLFDVKKKPYFCNAKLFKSKH